jgi:hypothetical protein
MVLIDCQVFLSIKVSACRIELNDKCIHTGMSKTYRITQRQTIGYKSNVDFNNAPFHTYY